MSNFPEKKPEIKPIPHINPFEPFPPDLVPNPEIFEPRPILPETEPLPKPEIKPDKF